MENRLNKKQLIMALVKELGISDNIFNYQAIDEEVSHIRDRDYIDFFKEVMKQDRFGNGLKAIMNISAHYKELYKLEGGGDSLELEAKRLIDLTKAMNDAIFQDHIKTGVPFDDLLRAAKFTSVSQEDLAILSNVRPHYDVKSLVGKINHYGTEKEAISAFKQALSKQDVTMIDNNVRKMIEG